MTPLAQMIARELCLPPRQRVLLDLCGLGKVFDNPSCFECSDVVQLADDLKPQLAARKDVPHLHFLPAPLTWLEASVEGLRIGWLIQKVEGTEGHAAVRRVLSPIDDRSKLIAMPGITIVDMEDGWHPVDASFPKRFVAPGSTIEKEVERLLSHVEYAKILTCIINSPRVAEFRQHPPHAGLQRKIAKAKGLPGKYELLPWSQVTLEISSQPSGRLPQGEEPATGTGQAGSSARVLHLCRSHLRFQHGHLVRVRSHFRGDASKGIRQTRYRVSDKSTVRADVARRGPAP